MCHIVPTPIRIYIWISLNLWKGTIIHYIHVTNVGQLQPFIISYSAYDMMLSHVYELVYPLHKLRSIIIKI